MSIHTDELRTQKLEALITPRELAASSPLTPELARHIRPYLQADEFITPLRNREGGLVGLLCIAWSQDVEHSQQESFAQFVDTISKSAAVAIETRQLILAQKALLAGMIKLIAGAVDAKSHYTGGHCQRVPELALMLMEKANFCFQPKGSELTIAFLLLDSFKSRSMISVFLEISFFFNALFT